MNDVCKHGIEMCRACPACYDEAHKPPPPVPGSVLPWWVTRKWDAEVCDCVRCGTSMRLNPDCEWDDDDEYNLCHNCCLELLKECMAKLNTEVSHAD